MKWHEHNHRPPKGPFGGLLGPVNSGPALRFPAYWKPNLLETRTTESLYRKRKCLKSFCWARDPIRKQWIVSSLAVLLIFGIRIRRRTVACSHCFSGRKVWQTASTVFTLYFRQRIESIPRNTSPNWISNAFRNKSSRKQQYPCGSFQ